jgi:PAS domain S-box-containing protein
VNDEGANNPELQQELAKRRASDERMQFALAAARIGVWEWDLSSDDITWFSTTALAYGLSPESLPTNGRAFLELIHPEDRQSLAEAMDRAIRSRTDLVTEFRSIASYDSVRWMEAHGRVVYDTHGTPIRLLGVNMDISSRKALEEQLRQAGIRMEVARLDVLKATMRTVQNIVSNALMSLYMFRTEVEGHASEKALLLFDQTISDTAAKLKALGDLDRVVETQMVMGTGIDSRSL